MDGEWNILMTTLTSLKLEKLPNILGLQHSVSENGRNQEELSRKEQLKEQDSSNFPSISQRNFLNPTDVKSSIAESLPPSSEEILTDKSLSQEKNIPNMKSSAISDPGLTGKGQDLEESWREHQKERYKKLLSFTGIDYVDLGSKSLNTSLASTRQDLWCTNKTSINLEPKNFLKTSWLSHTSSHVPTTDQGNIRAKKVKFLPNKTQKKILKMWIDHYRFTYNQAVEASKANGYTSNLKEFDLKKSLVTEKNLPEKHKFLTKTPYDIRAAAVFELCSNHKSEVTKNLKYYYKRLSDFKKELSKKIDAKEKAKTEKTKLKHQDRINELEKLIEDLEKNPTYNPDIKFKQKKAKRIVMDITKAKCDVKNGSITIFKRTLGKLRTKEKIDDLQHDIKISWDKSSGWYLIIPYTKPDERSQNPSANFIAIDPGYRTFLTGVDSNGRIREYGAGWYNDLNKNVETLDCLKENMKTQRENSKNHSYSNKERQYYRVLSLRTKKTMQMCETKILNKINYMHKKFARQLLDEYETILLPKMNSKNMVKQDLSPKINRMIMMGAQSKFHDYISFQGKGRVVKVDEKYTTKTCAKCMVRTDIQASKIFSCPSCMYTADRDINSAINILNKNFGVFRNTPTVDNADAC